MERYSMLTDWKYLVQPSSEKLPPTADGKKYKHPQSRHYKENERFWNTKTKWEVSIKSLTQEVREPLKRGGKKSVRARGDGGHQDNNTFCSNMSKAHVNSETKAACIGPTCVFTRSSVLMS